MSKFTIKQIIESKMKSFGIANSHSYITLSANVIMQSSDISIEPKPSPVAKSMFIEHVKEVMKEQKKTDCFIEIALNDNAGGTIADMVKAKAKLFVEVINLYGKISTNHRIEFKLNNFDITQATDYSPDLTKTQVWDRIIDAIIALMSDYDCLKNSPDISTSDLCFSWNEMSDVNLSDNALGEYTKTAMAKLMDSNFLFKAIRISDNDVSNITAREIAPVLKANFQLIDLDHNCIEDDGANALLKALITFNNEHKYSQCIYPQVSMSDNHLKDGLEFEDTKEIMFFLDPKLERYSGTDTELACGREGGYSDKAYFGLLKLQREIGQPIKKAAKVDTDSVIDDVVLAAAGGPLESRGVDDAFSQAFVEEVHALGINNKVEDLS